ncbi:transferase hexapeptide (six repeat-containing protein) [Paraoerskovia marina]|uniref:Transferase hexapeptide (Six repeat-containing protein) n=1 Tax=Paraoerskovia marina TaxID=545619 RepID=A0A1H1MV25_9CELL|nr:acyltransferase [Paraoerskovia marina]SDR90285.1 transferase hexapeptide (six repeat-containing protein) [Paraoerskovia marina]
MPALFSNVYPCRADQPLTGSDVAGTLAEHGVRVGEGTVFVDTPRVAYTQVSDAEHGRIEADPAEFEGSIRIGEGCYVESGLNPAFHGGPVRLSSIRVNERPAGQIRIGDRVVLQGVAVVAYERVEIGDDVMFGPNVTIMDSSGHPLRGRGQAGEAERTTSSPVTIGDRAWIGAGAMILKGVTVGEDAVVGAQSVVYEDVPAGCVALGNPARVVKQL